MNTTSNIQAPYSNTEDKKTLYQLPLALEKLRNKSQCFLTIPGQKSRQHAQKKSKRKIKEKGEETQIKNVQLNKAQIMQQYREKYLLSELFSIFDYLFRHYSLLDSNILFRKVRVSDQSSLQSYLRSGDSLLPEQDIISCLAYLQQVPKLKKFAQWIYDAAPQIFTNDLILATYIIVCSYYRQRLIHNSHDWIVSHILLELGAISNRSFQVLKISTEPCLYVGYVLKGEPCVLIFYRKLVETVIDLVQNQEGSEKKSKTRKKIDQKFEYTRYKSGKNGRKYIRKIKRRNSN